MNKQDKQLLFIKVKQRLAQARLLKNKRGSQVPDFNILSLLSNSPQAFRAKMAQKRLSMGNYVPELTNTRSVYSSPRVKMLLHSSPKGITKSLPRLPTLAGHERQQETEKDEVQYKSYFLQKEETPQIHYKKGRKHIRLLVPSGITSIPVQRRHRKFKPIAEPKQIFIRRPKEYKKETWSVHVTKLDSAIFPERPAKIQRRIESYIDRIESQAVKLISTINNY